MHATAQHDMARVKEQRRRRREEHSRAGPAAESAPMGLARGPTERQRPFDGNVQADEKAVGGVASSSGRGNQNGSRGFRSP